MEIDIENVILAHGRRGNSLTMSWWKRGHMGEACPEMELGTKQTALATIHGSDG